MSDELNHIFESVSSQVRHAFSDPTGQKRSPYQQIKESTLGFVHAVDWKETWLIALLTTLLALLCFVLLTRRQTNMQCVLFVFLSVIVFTAENINNFLPALLELLESEFSLDKVSTAFLQSVRFSPNDKIQNPIRSCFS